MAILSNEIFKSGKACLHLSYSSLISYRKCALKIALLLLIALCLWSRYCDITRSGHTRAAKCHCEPQSNYNYHPQNSFHLIKRSKTRQSRILIISEARSGSSFLGDLIQQASTTYYSFEPLIGVDPNSKLFDKLIFEIFHCRFDKLYDTYLRPIYWKLQYFKWNSMLVHSTDPRHPMQLFNHTLHRWICTQSNAILVKTIRFTLRDFWRAIGLYELNNLAIKVIYLVRDPRAVMSSRYRMTWCQNTENCTNSEVLCQRMRSNINTLKQIIKTSPLAGSVAIIRHEDLLMDMLNSAKGLLQFLQLNSMDQRLEEWIQSHTSIDDVLSNPHSTYRNIKVLASQWKTDLAPDELVEIEDNCLDVMRQLGYRSLQEEQRSNQTGQASTDSDSLENIESDYPLREVSVRQ